MALSSTVRIEFEDIQGNDGTVAHALGIWTVRKGPVTYNQWQSAYFAMLKEPFSLTDHTAIEGESQSERQDRMKEMFEHIETEIHGPDHLLIAIQGLSRPTSPHLSQAGGGGSGASAGEHAEGEGSLRAQETPAVGNALVPLQGGGAAAAAGPQVYPMETPEDNVAEEEVSHAESPDYYLRQEGIDDVWGLDQETLSETTTGWEERLERTSDAVAGMIQPKIQDKKREKHAVAFVVNVEQLAKQYKEAHAMESARTGKEGYEPPKQWAKQLLRAIDPAMFEGKMDLKAHVYALGRMAGYSVEMNNEWAERLWNSSVAGSKVPSLCENDEEEDREPESQAQPEANQATGPPEGTQKTEENVEMQKLLMYIQTLPEGSQRRQLAETYVHDAIAQGRLPRDAAAVMAECREMLRKAFPVYGGKPEPSAKEEQPPVTPPTKKRQQQQETPVSRGSLQLVSPPPDQTPSVKDMVNAVESMSHSFKEVFRDSMGKLVEKIDSKTAEEKGSEERSKEIAPDKFLTISGLDARRKPLIIDDLDPDLDSHDLRFENRLACNHFGKDKVGANDKLHMYGNTFKEGGTRAAVFENAIRQAQTDGRLPHEALEVLAEIRKELRTYIWETSMQKMTRLDLEFESMQQGSMSHSDFRAMFVRKLQDMRASDMDMPSEGTLYRKYLAKLRSEYRVGVQAREWRIDGADKPARLPKTWQEVAIAVGLFQEERADIAAVGVANAGDTVLTVNGVDGPAPSAPAQAKGGGKKSRKNPNGTVICGYCNQINNHETEICPTQAAVSRGFQANNPTTSVPYVGLLST